MLQGVCFVQWFGNNCEVMWCLLSLGENKVPIMSAMRFVKMLFQYRQPDAFTELAREMLQVLSVSSTQATHYSEKGNTLHFYQFSLVYAQVSNLCCVSEWILSISFCVRVWKVSHSGGPSWSLLYLTVSAVCCLPRGAILKRTTWLMVAKLKLCHIWITSL